VSPKIGPANDVIAEADFDAMNHTGFRCTTPASANGRRPCLTTPDRLLKLSA
jgi:hypothetical protein